VQSAIKRYWAAAGTVEAAARPLRLLCAGTGAKDQAVADTRCDDVLAAPDTVDITPERHCSRLPRTARREEVLPAAEVFAEAVLAKFAREGVEDRALAVRRRRKGAAASGKSSNWLMCRIAEKTGGLAKLS